MLDVDVQTYLPGDLLVKMDIATMAHSLEVRSPLLDHVLMERVARLPDAAEAARANAEGTAEGGCAAVAAGRGHRPPEDGLRRADRRLVPRPPG